MERKTNRDTLEVNLLAVLASAMYCQLKNSNRDRDIVDAMVSIVMNEHSDSLYSENSGGLYSVGISGYIKFGTMEDVVFGLKYGNHDGFYLRITQDIKSEDVTCLVPDEHSTPIWIDFPSHKVYYKWEEYFDTDLEPPMVDKPEEINAFAKKIIDTILSKVKAPKKYDFEIPI